MGLTKYELIPILCGIVVCIYCLDHVFLHGKSRNQRFVEKAKKLGCQTKGRSIATKIQPGNAYSGAKSDDRFPKLYVTYEYWVDGKRYITELYYIWYPGELSLYSDTDEITIYYDKNRPSKCVSAGEATKQEQQKNGCVLTIFITLCTIKIVYEILEHFF